MTFTERLRLMQDPTVWPRIPFLPMRRTNRAGQEEIGFLYLMPAKEKGGDDDIKLRPAVFIGSMYRHDRELTPLTHAEVMRLDTLRYHSYSSICFDGWEVIEWQTKTE